MDIQGVIKTSPEDFVVEEIPLYDPSGEGEHLYINVRKKNMSHDELVRKIAKEFGVTRRQIGVAGRKDLRAVTTQSVSIHLPKQGIKLPESIGSIEVLSYSRHTNKLRLGHLKGNAFVIRLRQLNIQDEKMIEGKLKKLQKSGLPNAFGPQRFGSRNNNHHVGLAVTLEDWERVVKELLSGDARHNTFAAEGEYKKALDSWPFGQPAERNVLELLSKGRSHESACKSIAKPLRKLWVNAFQSSLFNKVLAQRVQNQTWDKIIDGDVACNHGHNGRTFLVPQDEVGNKEILQRTASFEISPTGPLWGAKMQLASEKAGELERKVLQSVGVSDTNLRCMKHLVRGARRPLRICVENASFTSGIDSQGDFVEVAFTLPAGSYATVLIEHLLNGE